MAKEMIITICSTRNWYFYVATELYALFKYNDVKKVYLFIEDNAIDYIKDERVQFINVNNLPEYITPYSPNYHTKYSKLSYIRCYFSKIIPEPKVLYIDADAIVVDNIEGLWKTDLTGKALAGVHEGGEWSKHLRMEGMDDKYINSGVLLMNLDFIRKEKLDNKMLELLNSKRYAFPDQDVINIACKDKINYISNVYNSTETTGVVDDAKIIHYIRERKGWIKESPRSEIWYKHYYEMLERSDTMVKVKCITEYDDNQLGRRIKLNEEFIVTDKRAEELVKEPALVKVIEVIPEAKPEETKPAKPRKKK